MARVKRGEVWLTHLNPGFGTEIHKKRPVLIVSNDQINQYLPTVIVVPLSSQIAPLGPEKVFVAKKEAGLDVDSVVLAPGIRAIDRTRLIKKLGFLPRQKLFEVEEAVKLVLGMLDLE